MKIPLIEYYNEIMETISKCGANRDFFIELLSESIRIGSFPKKVDHSKWGFEDSEHLTVDAEVFIKRIFGSSYREIATFMKEIKPIGGKNEF